MVGRSDRSGRARCARGSPGGLERRGRVPVSPDHPEQDGHLGNDGPYRLCGPGGLLRPAVVDGHLQRLPDTAQVCAQHDDDRPRRRDVRVAWQDDIHLHGQTQAVLLERRPRNRRGRRVLVQSHPQDRRPERPSEPARPDEERDGVRKQGHLQAGSPRRRMAGRADDGCRSDRRPESVPVQGARARREDHRVRPLRAPVVHAEPVGRVRAEPPLRRERRPAQQPVHRPLRGERDDARLRRAAGPDRHRLP